MRQFNPMTAIQRSQDFHPGPIQRAGPSSIANPSVAKQRGNAASIVMVILIFAVIFIAGAWAVINYGEGHVVINGRDVSDLEIWEVVGGLILGFIGLIVGLVFGVVGLVIGIIAMLVSLILGLAGVAVGMFFTAGTLLGPFLLLAAIILLLRRRKAEG